MDFAKLFQEYTQLQQFVGALRTSIGAALTTEQQVFVSNNLKGFLPWIQTAEGRIAVAQLVTDWKDCLQKTTQKQVDSSAESG